ncbi:MAG: adenylyl-sulfate kinase [Alphaproteobacteria bacterium]
MVIWITGMSGAGKTTLGNALARLLKPRLPHLFLIDGDVIRSLFGGDLDYSEPSRRTQIGRLQRLAQWLERQGGIAIVAALYAHPELLEWNRANFDAYFEVYLEAPLELLRQRDSKGLYAAASDGRIANVVGVDIPWHAPARSDLIIDVGAGSCADAMAHQVIAGIPRFAALAA